MDDPKVWCTRVEQIFNYQVIPNSQKFPLTSFHPKAETMEWWQWLKHAYKKEDKEDEEKFLHLNLQDKVPGVGGGINKPKKSSMKKSRTMRGLHDSWVPWSNMMVEIFSIIVA